MMLYIMVFVVMDALFYSYEEPSFARPAVIRDWLFVRPSVVFSRRYSFFLCWSPVRRRTMLIEGIIGNSFCRDLLVESDWWIWSYWGIPSHLHTDCLDCGGDEDLNNKNSGPQHWFEMPFNNRQTISVKLSELQKVSDYPESLATVVHRLLSTRRKPISAMPVWLLSKLWSARTFTWAVLYTYITTTLLPN